MIFDSSGAQTPSAIRYKSAGSRTYETVELGNTKCVAGTGIDPNVIAGTLMSTQEIPTGTVLETHGITDKCPTKTPAEVRPVRVAEDPVLSSTGHKVMYCRSARGYPLSYQVHDDGANL